MTHLRTELVLDAARAEIGEQLGLKPGTSANRLLRARQQLRALLGTDYALRWGAPEAPE